MGAAIFIILYMFLATTVHIFRIDLSNAVYKRPDHIKTNATWIFNLDCWWSSSSRRYCYIRNMGWLFGWQKHPSKYYSKWCVYLSFWDGDCNYPRKRCEPTLIVGN